MYKVTCRLHKAIPKIKRNKNYKNQIAKRSNNIILEISSFT